MLELHGLRKRFGGHLALDGVSLRLEAGEVFGLLGPNGAGKSTLCAISVGLIEADEGMVQIGAHGSPRDPAVRRHIGFAPQSLAIYTELSGRENLEFFAAAYGLHGAALHERVAWALKFAGLEDRRDSLARTYSGGMARRLNLAAALVHDPQLVLLDEPTVGVDPQSRNALLENIEGLRDRGVTVLYTTHYMEEAERLCDRVAILDAGRLLALDTTAALLRTHAGPTRLCVEVPGEGPRSIETKTPAETLAALTAELGPGRTPTQFHVERPSLERVFLNLTGRSLRD